MGLEIDRTDFDEASFRAFEARLERSLRALETLLARPGFGEGEATLGAEVEVSLVDAAGRPVPANEAVLAESRDPRLTVEINRFNLESNLDYGPLAGASFEALRREMNDVRDEMSRAAALHGARVAMIGIVPTLEAADLQSEMMTDSARFRALSASLRRLRHEPFRIDIHGEDALELHSEDVTFEGAATSLQLHLRVAPDDFARVYNAIQWATPVVLALGANSPTFLGKRLWDETRVALFKQSVDARTLAQRGEHPARVAFGSDWIDGPFEPFRDSVARHPVLLPVLTDEDPDAALANDTVPALRELRLHQGTVWSWNRAIFDPAGGGHLRVELRALPSGPTVEDMLASAAFHLGLALDLAAGGDARPAAPFERIHADFYRAAREGPDAELAIPGDAAAERRPLRAHAEALLVRAQSGLDRAGVVRTDSEPLLAIVQRRVERGLTGARWQRHTLAAEERTRPRREAIAAMFGRYLSLADEGAPVADWPATR